MAVANEIDWRIRFYYPIQEKVDHTDKQGMGWVLE